MSSKTGQPRRASIYKISGTAVLNALKSKIKSADSAFIENETLGCFFQYEEAYLKNKIRRYRRVYMPDHKYKVGWVVDSDINFCMICLSSFGWFGLKHHCRACGLLVCGGCSPYSGTIPYLLEEEGSRICKQCNAQPPIDTSNLHITNHDIRPSTGTIGNRMVVSRTELSLDSYGDEAIEKEMIPKYEHAYNTMRGIIPLDICSANASYDKLVNFHGLPEPVAQRIWSTKILWLIVMHPDDIAKLSINDFRTKYLIRDDLDIVEMRAIWFNLPGWEEIPDSENADATPNSVYTMQVAKNKWRLGFKARLDALTEKESRNALSVDNVRNEAYLEYPTLSIFDPEAPLQSHLDITSLYSEDTDNGQLNTTENSPRYNSVQQDFEAEGAVDNSQGNSSTDISKDALNGNDTLNANNLLQTTSPREINTAILYKSPSKRLSHTFTSDTFAAHIENGTNGVYSQEFNQSNDSAEVDLRRSFEELSQKRDLNVNTNRVLTQYYKEQQQSARKSIPNIKALMDVMPIADMLTNIESSDEQRERPSLTLLSALPPVTEWIETPEVAEPKGNDLGSDYDAYTPYSQQQNSDGDVNVNQIRETADEDGNKGAINISAQITTPVAEGVPKQLIPVQRRRTSSGGQTN